MKVSRSCFYWLWEFIRWWTWLDHWSGRKYLGYGRNSNSCIAVLVLWDVSNTLGVVNAHGVADFPMVTVIPRCCYTAGITVQSFRCLANVHEKNSASTEGGACVGSIRIGSRCAGNTRRFGFSRTVDGKRESKYQIHDINLHRDVR